VAGPISNVIGFDDGPFQPEHRGDVLLVGVVCARTRCDGVVSGKIRRDGRNSTATMVELLRDSPFYRHVRAVLLQGIAVGGFNVVDIHQLHRELDRPVLVVARREPRLWAMKDHLVCNVPGWQRKWRLIEAAGPMEPLRGIYVQRVGLSLDQAGHLLAATTGQGLIPEPLRLAHLIAGGVTTGQSRGRA